MSVKKISFNKRECDFVTVLKERVNSYFKDSSLSHKANVFMIFKSILMMGLVALIYLAILLNLGGGLATIGLYVLLGFFSSIGTMNIAHDALHGAYLSHSRGNRALGLLLDLFGASSFYWKKEHVVDHHTFTNIAGHDADLGATTLLRLCPKAPYRTFHRFQHFYAPFLYCLNIIRWIYFSDLKRIYWIFRTERTAAGKPPRNEVFLMIFFKFLHVFLFLILPLIVLPLPFWIIFLGYLAFLSTQGITLTTIFQLAHIVENVAFPLPNEEGKIDNSFIKHQFATTSNFAMKSRLASFVFGGLNFQIEHHLFPHICHMHLRKISPIVETTAKEFGLPYHHHTSFFGAIRSHFKTLKKLGKSP